MKKTLLIVALSVFTLSHALPEEPSVPQIGVKAPSFTAQSTNGKIKFPSDFGNNWKIIFSHPKDFTPVCSSEILELAYEQDNFEKLGAKILVVSTDILEQHNSWKAALEEVSFQDRDPVEIKFPIVEDNSLDISKKYGMIHSQVSIKENIRGVYFINPDNVVRAVYFYPNEVGRNIEELKRTLIALQKTYHDDSIVTPVNWQPGDDVVVPVLSQKDKENLGSADSDYYQLTWFMTFRKEK